MNETELEFYKTTISPHSKLKPWIVKELDRKLAGVSAIRDVTNIANMLMVFDIFFILLYFSH